MKLDAILHIPMSEYAHGLDENHIVFRLRCAKGDLKRCTLYYGDTACRVTPILFTPAPMELTLSDLYHDYYQLVLNSPYQRLYYYFELDDGWETVLYYGDVFTDHLVDDRSEYFKLPFNHRADIARVPDWVHDAVVYNIFPDSFASARKDISLNPSQRLYNGVPVKGKLGGTLWGAAENAEYLQKLGINCVYLNPIFAAGEYHKYDLLDYYHVDPCFGGDEAFRIMVDEFHKRGIRVIIDGVFNHCGWYFFAFDDVVRNQEQSRYKDWFYYLEFPVVRPADSETYPTYACFGYERMMPKLNTANPEVRDYFAGVGAYWVREFGIDGWRLDVASEVDDGFWRIFRRAVKAENPDALLIGEVWESASHWLGGDMFDSTMNYDFRKHCRRFFGERSMNAAEFSGRLTNMLTRYRTQMLFAQLNLLDSHDVSRFLSLCGGDLRPYRLAILFLMSFVGMPTIFYGDEHGVQGVLEEEYRAPMPWQTGNTVLREFFRRAITMRHELVSLRRGDFRVSHADCGSGLLAFVRRFGGETVAVYLNCSPESAELTLPHGAEYWTEGLENGQLSGFGFAILVDGHS